MKAIATLKAPAKKRRVVVCGNYAMARENEELANAASGCDSLAIRTIGAIDVKAAFLQAPRRTQMTRVTVGEPPSLLKSMNLVKPDEKWIIKQALYGLTESLGDWGNTAMSSSHTYDGGMLDRSSPSRRRRKGMFGQCDELVRQRLRTTTVSCLCTWATCHFLGTLNRSKQQQMR